MGAYKKSNIGLGDLPLRLLSFTVFEGLAWPPFPPHLATFLPCMSGCQTRTLGDNERLNPTMVIICVHQPRITASLFYLFGGLTSLIRVRATLPIYTMSTHIHSPPMEMITTRRFPKHSQPQSQAHQNVSERRTSSLIHPLPAHPKHRR